MYKAGITNVLNVVARFLQTKLHTGYVFWQDYLNANSKLHFKLKPYFMSSLLYLIAVILIIGWLLGFFAFHAGGLIHILLVIAIIAILLRLIGGSRI
jgi:hypothetical protein